MSSSPSPPTIDPMTVNPTPLSKNQLLLHFEVLREKYRNLEKDHNTLKNDQ